MVQVPEAPPMSSRRLNSERLDGLDDLVGHRGRDAVHTADKGLLLAGLAPHAGDCLGRPAGLGHARQLRPVSQATGLVLGHGQNALRTFGCQQGLDSGRKRIAVARLFQKLQRCQGIQKNGQAALVALKDPGQLGCAERGRGQGAEKVQVSGRGKNRRVLVVAA